MKKKIQDDKRTKDTPPDNKGRSKATGYPETELAPSFVKEAAVAYNILPKQLPDTPKSIFTVTRGGKRTSYAVPTGYGYLIPAFKKAKSKSEVAGLIERGISSEEIRPVIEYLGLKVPEIARAASVSTSTVFRWGEGTSIGVPGSHQFFRIDRTIQKGVELFGGLEEFKTWLQNPNLALGNAVPAKLLLSVTGIEWVDEALDALHYGNVM